MKAEKSGKTLDMGKDTKHITGPKELYMGAIIWAEFGWVDGWFEKKGKGGRLHIILPNGQKEDREVTDKDFKSPQIWDSNFCIDALNQAYSIPLSLS